MVKHDKKKQVKTQQIEFDPVKMAALLFSNWVVFSHQNFSLGRLGALANESGHGNSSLYDIRPPLIQSIPLRDVRTLGICQQIVFNESRHLDRDFRKKIWNTNKSMRKGSQTVNDRIRLIRSFISAFSFLFIQRHFGSYSILHLHSRIYTYSRLTFGGVWTTKRLLKVCCLKTFFIQFKSCLT